MDDSTAQQLRAALDEAHLVKRPVAVLDLDAINHNLRSLRRRAQGKPVRLASKSLRVRQLLNYCLAETGFKGVLAYCLAEAIWLARCGVKDIVVAYPSVDVESVRVLASDEFLAETITLMVDSVEQLDLVDTSLGSHPTLRVALELDAAYAPLHGLRFGALRSPIRSAAASVQLAELIGNRPGWKLVGLMSYEGQIAGVADGGMGPYRSAVRIMKKFSAKELANRRHEAVQAVAQIAPLEFVNGGGTGSFETTAQESAVTELAAGSGIVGPALFDRYRAFRPRPALHFGLDVVRRPDPHTVTVLGGGWVASGPPGKDRLPVIAWPQQVRYARDEAAGEVQTPLVGPGAQQLQLGDIAWFRHAKAGELAERVESYVVVQRVQGSLKVTDQWPTYRGEKHAWL